MDKQRKLEFGEYIRFMRNSVGWSKAKLGKLMNVRGMTISNWEKGKVSSKNDIWVLEYEVSELVKSELRKRRGA